MNIWRHNIFAYFTQADLAYYTYKGVHKILYTPLKNVVSSVGFLYKIVMNKIAIFLSKTVLHCPNIR